MKILVVGCGSLGSTFAQLALRAGHNVSGLRRSTRALPEGVHALQGDVRDPSTLALPPGLDAIVYCISADGRSDEAYAAAYPAGLRNVLDAWGEQGSDTRTNGPPRVLFVSSTAVYAQDDGGTVHEESETVPTAFNGVRMLEAEHVLADHSSGGRVAGTALRLGGIYGGERTYLIDAVRAGAATYSPTRTEWSNRIHVTDAARAILHVLTLADPPAILNVVDPHPAPRREVLTWLAERLGAPEPKAAEEARRRGGNKRVDSARLSATGFDFDYPSYRTGFFA